MDALQYEYLIRAAHQCEQDDAYGANAAIYRQMDYAFDILGDNHWGNKNPDKESNFRNKFITVKFFVSDALKAAANKICYEATAEETETLDRFIAALQSPDFFDKHQLDCMISESLDILKENGFSNT